MKNSVILRVLAFLVFLLPHMAIYSQETSQKLSSFIPLTGKTWEGDLLSPSGEIISKVILTFELSPSGNMVKVVRRNQGHNAGGEGFFYWNDPEGVIAFFFIEPGGVFQTGNVTWAGDTLTIEGAMTWPIKQGQGVKQSYDFRNTFELTSDGTLIDRWFMNAFGPWRPGHVITFR